MLIKDRLLNWFDKNKNLLIFMFVFGFMANVLVITTNIVSSDNIWLSEYFISSSSTWDLSIGRWALRYFNYLRFGLSSSVVSTMYALINLSISVVLIIDLFEIKNKLYHYLLCAIYVVSPFLIFTLFSTFCSAEFMMAHLLAVLSIYLIYKYDYKSLIVISAVLLAISLGLYQAYIGIATSLAVLLSIYYLVTNKLDIKNVLFKFLRCVIMVILGIVFYEILLHVHLAIFKVALGDYSGASSIGLKNILLLPKLIKDAYLSFYKFFYTNDIINNIIYHRGFVSSVIFIVMLGLLVFSIKPSKKNVLKICLTICLLIILPIAMSVCELIAPERDINILMCAPYVLFYPFIMALGQANFRINIHRLLIIVCCLFIFVSYLVMSNATYMYARTAKEKIVSDGERILDRIYSLEDYYTGIPVMFIGNGRRECIYDISNPSLKLAISEDYLFPYVWDDNVDMVNMGWQRFYKYYLGVDINIASSSLYFQVLDSDEYQEMNAFPYYDSVRIIDGVAVVKIEPQVSY